MLRPEPSSAALRPAACDGGTGRGLARVASQSPSEAGRGRGRTRSACLLQTRCELRAQLQAQSQAAAACTCAKTPALGPRASSDQMGLRLGMWCWKDDTKTLEYRSTHVNTVEWIPLGPPAAPGTQTTVTPKSRVPSGETFQTDSFAPSMEFKEKGKKGKAVHFTESDGSASDRLIDKRFIFRDDKSKISERRSQQGVVTLHDVKFVALLFLQDTEMQRICSFTTFMRNKYLDNFLIALLNYLSHFLEKISLEMKPQSYMVGLVEKKEMELVINNLEAAQVYLAQKYCTLVLGLGMPDKHHMNCGKEKVSDTQKDWKFFEAFFTFCAYVAWIVFRRKHFTEIEEEIGRLFRTDMFNIPRRKREDDESGGQKKDMTFVQFRRMMTRRPAIKKAIYLRSPVMSTLLPSLRQKAQNVEKSYQVGTKYSVAQRKQVNNLDFVPLQDVGILGAPRRLFNPHTLLPLEPEESMKQSGRNYYLIERNNQEVQDTLDLIMKTWYPQCSLPK